MVTFWCAVLEVGPPVRSLPPSAPGTGYGHPAENARQTRVPADYSRYVPITLFEAHCEVGGVRLLFGPSIRKDDPA